MMGKLVVEEDFVKRIRRHYDEGVASGGHSAIHGWSHVNEVAKAAVKIVRGEHGGTEEELTAFLAGLLHDYERPSEGKLREKGRQDEHEKHGAVAAREILSKEGYSQKIADAVAAAIATHSFGISVGHSRECKEPYSLAGMALKAADKLAQARPGVVWARAVFLGECTGGKSGDNEKLEYCRKREKKLEEFFETPAGKLLEKYYPDSRKGLAFVKEFNDELEKEISAAGASRDADSFLNVAGALGIVRLGEKAGARGTHAGEFRLEYAKRLGEFEADIPTHLEDALEFSRKMLAAPFKERS
ncbi:MAG: HD domain-containing protein [Candidatus Micrarchaeota archaeon]